MVGHGEPSRFECSLCLPAWPALGFKQTMWFSTMTASLQVERSKKKWSNQSRQYIHIYTWDGNTEVRWSRRGSKASLCKSVLCAQVSVCKSFLVYIKASVCKSVRVKTVVRRDFCVKASVRKNFFVKAALGKVLRVKVSVCKNFFVQSVRTSFSVSKFFCVKVFFV